MDHRSMMSSRGAEENAANQEALEDILAGPSAIELPQTPPSQPHPSGVSKRGSHDSEDNIERHTSTGEEYDSGVEGNQEGESEAEGANEAGENEAENESQDNDNEAQESNDGRQSETEDASEAGENEAENESQDNDNESRESNDGRQSEAEGADQQNRRAIQSYIATLEGTLLGVINDCDRIPDSSRFPWQCSRSFLEKLQLDTVKRKIEDIDASLDAVSQLGDLLKLYVIHIPVFHKNNRHGVHLRPNTPSNLFSKAKTIRQHSPLRLEFPGLYDEIPYDTLQRVITESIKVIVDHWQQLYDAVRKECDGENISFMNGEQYVHLLYDDGTFRRSRFYFWAIGCLSAFTQSVAETLWELTTFREMVHNDQQRRQHPDDICIAEMEAFDEAYKSLEIIHSQLVLKRDELKVLRDGLFSASGVMESRQSRILGENVQLLAFVTIFFLPLAFSASLWSIPGVNDKYPGIMIPGAFAAIIGFITYFIVFNLNLLISGLRRLFAAPRRSLLAKMMKEHDTNDDSKDNSEGESTGKSENSEDRKDKSDGKRTKDWPTRAKAFEVFPRQEEGPRSSNWVLLFYAIRLLVLKAFDLVIGLLAWLREIIASRPSDQDPDTEMADRAAPNP
ncbi:hypothetical protein V493_04728 [Pseudogymnoascus sp. VKM F-4281 (FW-2241)]|nr:hypothetical protein V493_04728 [Pseudogymnoascus sp. VKM F-4281 (FW-2241)]